MQSWSPEHAPRHLLRAAGILLIAAASALLSGCPGPGAPAEFRIGFIVPLSGPYAPNGRPHLAGAGLAVSEANRDGGLLMNGRRYKVVLVVRDGSNTPEQGLSAAQELVSRERVSAIVGPILSVQAIPVAHLVDRAGIPMVTQIATNPDVTYGTRGVYRVCYTDDFQGSAMARFAVQHLGARRVALLFDQANPYNNGIARIFAQEFVALGGSVAATETYTTGEQNFRPQLLRIKASRADVLFLPNYPTDVEPQVTQARELGIQARILGSDSMDLTDSRYYAAIEGAWFSVHFSPENPGPNAQGFLAAYNEAYGMAPDQSAALSYDALGLLFQAAVSRQSTDPRELLIGLHELDVFQGVTGTMVFRGFPNPRKGAAIMRVVKGVPRFQMWMNP